MWLRFSAKDVCMSDMYVTRPRIAGSELFFPISIAEISSFKSTLFDRDSLYLERGFQEYKI